MRRYIIERLLWLIVISVCVTILIFTIMHFVPGDPARLMLGDAATEAEVQALRDSLGLNDPFFVQMGNYVYNVFFKFDFGISYNYKTPVVTEFVSRLPRTLALGWTALILSTVIAIPLGITCAMKRNTFWDQFLRVVAMVGISIPNFWLALLMVMLFSVKLDWLPPYGLEGGIKCWIMPVAAIMLSEIARMMRSTRSAVLETIRADFVTTARAKGLPEQSVIYKHMLPNAMIPIINMIGSGFAHAITGTVVIETVFSFPGIGTYMTKGVTNRDYPVVQACVLALALTAALVNLIVDLVYAYIDPRIKAQYANYGAKKKKVSK